MERRGKLLQLSFVAVVLEALDLGRDVPLAVRPASSARLRPKEDNGTEATRERARNDVVKPPEHIGASLADDR